jgi:hypothetical protein
MTASTRSAWAGLKAVARGAAALLILFEEWGWTPLARWLGRVARGPSIDRLERRIAGLAPRLALAVLCVPALMLLPVKIGALWLMGLGRVAIGVGVLVLAKILGTAVVARLFTLTQPQLMQLGWFARAHAHWIPWKTRAIAGLLASPAWVASRAAAARLRALWRGA